MNLEKAQLIAEAIKERLEPCCKIIDIAGSVRRLKPDVKDIEICCVPKTVLVGQASLFNPMLVTLERDQSFISVANNLGTIIKGKPDGKYMQIALKEINLDLFIPDEHDYYRQLAIRTGSSDYSFKVIAVGWKKLGWCGSDHGLRKMKDCIESKTPDGKSKWKLINKEGDMPPFWKSEPEFFDWLGIKWIHPTQRNI